MGNRKQKGFYFALAAIVLIVIVALFSGVEFTGDNIERFAWIIGILAGTFFGANFGEHWTKKGIKAP